MIHCVVRYVPIGTQVYAVCNCDWASAICDSKRQAAWCLRSHIAARVRWGEPKKRAKRFVVKGKW